MNLLQTSRKFITLENVSFASICVAAVLSSSTMMSDASLVPKQIFTTLVFFAALLAIGIKNLFRPIRIQFPEIATIITAIAALESLYVLFQLLTFRYLGIAQTPTGNFDNPAGLISLLCLSFPFSVYLLQNFKQHRVFFSICICLIFAATLASGSRTGIIAISFVGVYAMMSMLGVSRSIKLICMGASVLALVASLYFVNTNSADGRILIWKASLPMLTDTPFFGFGNGAFARHYMGYQAAFLQNQPADSNYAMLADVVMVPFNEYINLFICLGWAGMVTLIALAAICLYSCVKQPSGMKTCAMLSLISLSFIAFFSYPIQYPFTCIALCVSLWIILKPKALPTFTRWIKVLFSSMAIIAGIVGGTATFNEIRAQKTWRTAFLTGDTALYGSLEGHYASNPNFHYNYAFRLFETGDFTKSLEIADKCRSRLAHYDLEVLLGDLHYKAEDYERAKQHYTLASQMCPNRFVPLLALHNVALKQSDLETARKIAEEISDKPIKIPSRKVKLIKYKTKLWLEQN